MSVYQRSKKEPWHQRSSVSISGSKKEPGHQRSSVSISGQKKSPAISGYQRLKKPGCCG